MSVKSINELSTVCMECLAEISNEKKDKFFCSPYCRLIFTRRENAKNDIINENVIIEEKTKKKRVRK